MKKESIQFLTLAILISLSIENAQANGPTQQYYKTGKASTTNPPVTPSAPSNGYISPKIETFTDLKGQIRIIPKQPNRPVPIRPGTPQGIILQPQAPAQKQTPPAKPDKSLKPTTNNPTVQEQLNQIRSEQQLQSNSIFNQKSQQPADNLNLSTPTQTSTAQQNSALKTPEQIAAQTATPASKNNSVLTWFKNLLSSSNTTNKPNQTPAAANQPAAAPAKTSSSWWPSFMNRSPQKPSPTTTQPATTTAQTSSSWLPSFMHRSPQKPSSAAGIQNTKNSTGSTNTGDTPEMIRDSENLL